MPGSPERGATRRHAGARAAALLALALASAALAGAAPEPARPDILLVVVDTLRADRVERLAAAGELPFLAALARRGTWFRDAHSTSSWTPTATASILTGVYPSQHGVRRGLMAVTRGDAAARLGPVDRLPATLESLPETLRRHGYATFGVVDNPNAGRALGFARGFDAFEEGLDQGAGWVARRASALHRARTDRRPALWYLHFNDPHAPYRRHARLYATRTATREGEALARYDSEIRTVDRALSRLAPALGFAEGGVIVLAGDHGEAFGEHGHHGHPNQLYGELVRVPLLIASPEGARGERRTPASLVDVAPTLCALLSLRPPAQYAGRALLPAREAPPRALYAMRWSETLSPALARKAVITARHKLVVTEPSGRVELYDRASDPGERRNLYASESATTARLRAQLDAFERAAPRFAAQRITLEHDRALLERLRALGYGR